MKPTSAQNDPQPPSATNRKQRRKLDPIQQMNRRKFLQGLAATGVTAATGGAVFHIARGVPPSERVNVACVGVAAQGGSIARGIGGQNIANVVALCDVHMDRDATKETLEQFPNAKRFTDFRKMLEEMGDDIDAVTIGTPDHSHFPIAMLAMSMGKGVYVEKPLSNSFQETELMMAAEKKYKVAAQLGNQGHSGNNYHQWKSWTEGGIIKDITKVIGFMNSGRRWHGWGNVTGYESGASVPDGLDWDLWHATAEMRPFSPRLHPGNWRGWYRYGNGAFGDWGPHILDTAHRFLNLGLPYEIEAVELDQPNPYIFPMASTIKFSFAARGDQPPVEVWWYDGTRNKPETPPGFDGELRNAGKFVIGKDLIFHGGTHGDTVRIIPEEKMQDMRSQLPPIERDSNSNHHRNFLLGVKGEEQCRSSLDVAGPLSMVFNLGVICQELGGKLQFDTETHRFTNSDEANHLLAGPPPRQGWEQYYRL